MHILYHKHDGRLYAFLEKYDKGFYLVSPINGSGFFDREEAWVEDERCFIRINSQQDLKMVKLLFGLD